MLLNPATPLVRATLTEKPADAGHRASGGLRAQSRRTRLAYLVSRYPAVSHTFIMREVLQLRARGFDVEVASINSPDPLETNLPPDEREEARRTYYVKRHGVAGALAAHAWGLRRPFAYARGLWCAVRLAGWNLSQAVYAAFYFTEALMLGRWMQARGMRHLHVHFASAAANVGLMLKQFQPIGLSLTVHGPDEFYDARGQWLREKLAAADFVVCIGGFARSQLMHLSPAEQWHKLEICPLGVDSQRYRPAARPVHGGPFTVLCVGRLVPAKGQRILIDACGALRDAGRDIRLVLVGAGPDEGGLRQRAAQLGLAQCVEFTGALNQDEVLAWYRRADAFALASFAEGIPVVLMEAMASGIPCVSTRITGIPELIRDGTDGLLVTPSDVDEMAAALGYLMDDAGLCEELARNGRARVQQNYDLASNAERLARLFNKHVGDVA